MSQGIRYFCLLGIFLFIGNSHAAALNQGEAATLLQQFSNAQKTEVKAMNHRQNFELKELRISQDTRLREWEKAERAARIQFFEVHTKGPDRRTYIQDFIKRRELVRKQFVDQRTQKISDHEASLKVLKDDQAQKMNQFRESIQKGDLPSQDLWPKPGM